MELPKWYNSYSTVRAFLQLVLFRTLSSSTVRHPAIFSFLLQAVFSPLGACQWARKGWRQHIVGFSTPFLPYSDVLTQGTNISKGDGNFPRAFMILRMASKSFPLEANYSLKGNTNSEPPNPSSLADPSIDVNNLVCTGSGMQRTFQECLVAFVIPSLLIHRNGSLLP